MKYKVIRGEGRKLQPEVLVLLLILMDLQVLFSQSSKVLLSLD